MPAMIEGLIRRVLGGDAHRDWASCRGVGFREIGQAYEKMLDSSARRSSGAHYTPRALARRTWCDTRSIRWCVSMGDCGQRKRC